MNFINDIDFVARGGCGVLHIINKITNLSDPIIRGPVDFLNINTVALCYFHAKTAGTARLYGRSFFAIEHPR